MLHFTSGGSRSSGIARDEHGRQIGPEDTEHSETLVDAATPEATGPRTRVDLRSDTVAGTPAAEEATLDAVPPSSSALWDNAPRSRRRYRAKQHEYIDHEAVLGPEPQTHPDDLAAARDPDPGVEGAEELIPPLRLRVPPARPPHSEIVAHQVTHLPFRSWCDICVSARGLSRPHRTSPQIDSESSTVHRVAFDWAFLRDHEGGAA